jgi:hypothetical protein
MATLLTVRINFGTKQKPDYKPLTIKINDQLDQFGNQVQAWHEQSEREQKEKAPRIFVGNGRVIWTDGKIQTAQAIKKQKENESM